MPRDPMDRRLLVHPAAGTFDPTPTNVNPAGDLLTTDFEPDSPPSPLQDDDHDGMPDAWEEDRGLDSSVDDHNDTSLSAGGYTNLEVYLALRAQELLGAPHTPSTDASPRGPTDQAVRRPASTKAP